MRCQASELRKYAILDTSVLINLVHSEHVHAILERFQYKCAITHEVKLEIDRGKKTNRISSVIVDDLVNEKIIESLELTQESFRKFLMLVSLPRSASVGDGEASTIALADEVHGIVCVDDKKASKACGEYFPSLDRMSSVDLFFEIKLDSAFGESHLAESVYNALRNARMHVPDNRLDDVVFLIGRDRAKECTSLPRSHR